MASYVLRSVVPANVLRAFAKKFSETVTVHNYCLPYVGKEKVLCNAYVADRPNTTYRPQTMSAVVPLHNNCTIWPVLSPPPDALDVGDIFVTEEAWELDKEGSVLILDYATAKKGDDTFLL